jgi:hypothetical protein
MKTTATDVLEAYAMWVLSRQFSRLSAMNSFMVLMIGRGVLGGIIEKFAG